MTDTSISAAENTDFFDVLEQEWREAFPDQDIACEPVMTRMTRLIEELDLLVDKAFEPIGLGRGEVEVLCAVARSPEHRLLPKDILKKTVVSSGGLTARIDRLERRGAIVRLRNPEDRRSAILQATPLGLELAVLAHKAHVEAELEFIKVLSKEDRSSLNRLLKQLTLANTKC